MSRISQSKNWSLLTDMNTSSACCKIATRDQPNFFISLIRVGLCTVAEGCVRNSVGKRLRSESAGLEAPQQSCRLHLNVYSIKCLRLHKYVFRDLHFTNHNQIPHFGCLSHSGTHGTASRQQHQFLRLVVKQIVHHAGAQTGLALQHKDGGTGVKKRRETELHMCTSHLAKGMTQFALLPEKTRLQWRFTLKAN